MYAIVLVHSVHLTCFRIKLCKGNDYIHLGTLEQSLFKHRFNYFAIINQNEVFLQDCLMYIILSYWWRL